jgi:RecB family exonuclease
MAKAPAVKKIKSWSYSRLLDFESCPLKAKLKIIDRIPEPERPLKPGQTEHANDRGTRVHSEIELYVKGTGEFPQEARHFKDEIESLKSHYKAGRVSLEGEWAFNKNWEPVDWLVGWVRLKCDAVVFLTPTHAAVVDYKTGRRFGNEVKHGEQLQMYALSVLLKYPQIEHVTCELWYTDVNDLAVLDVVRPIGMRFLKPFDRRGTKMTEAVDFPPNANTYSCQYCPYHPAKGTGDCAHGV